MFIHRLIQDRKGNGLDWEMRWHLGLQHGQRSSETGSLGFFGSALQSCSLSESESVSVSESVYVLKELPTTFPRSSSTDLQSKTCNKSIRR